MRVTARKPIKFSVATILMVMFVFSGIVFIANRSDAQIDPTENIRNSDVNLYVLLWILPLVVLGYIYKSAQGRSKEIIAKWKEGSAEFKVEHTANPSSEALREESKVRRRYFLILFGITGMVAVFIVYQCGLSLIPSIIVLLPSVGAVGMCGWLEIGVRGKHILILLRGSNGTYLIHNEANAYRLEDVAKVILTTSKTTRHTHKRDRNCAVSLITKSVLRDIHLGFNVYNVNDLITLFDKANMAVDIRER